jgi:hypothetical protein
MPVLEEGNTQTFPAAVLFYSIRPGTPLSWNVRILPDKLTQETLELEASIICKSYLL